MRGSRGEEGESWKVRDGVGFGTEESRIPGPAPRPFSLDYATTPFLVIWEVTRACSLHCLHCRADAQFRRDPRELTTEEGFRLLDELAEWKVPLVVLTGGDPFERPDVFDLVRYGAERGLRMSVTPSATPRVTREALERLKEAGVMRLAVSLDGARAETHDRFRGTSGSFAQTMRILKIAAELGIERQVNTTVSRYNVGEMEKLAGLVAESGAVLWSVFFLVPTGRGRKEDAVDYATQEGLYRWLAELADRAPFDIKTTEAQPYRRVLVQRRQMMRGMEGGFGTGGGKPGGTEARRGVFGGSGRAPRGVNDGNGFVFVSHIGEVYPSGFLPIRVGDVHQTSLREIYRDSSVLRALRDPDGYEGKCGVCEFRRVCGGSRARAYALTGDYLESDPSCPWVPAVLRDAAEAGGGV
ncbi:TIGR04053 family radical SAM/SPASM domain-containing protein [Kyrpidia spormannii]|uniref:TIGR04053 family radical SAM/SPASM domain-containing protein n=1 Tax=Kyrpidia spormannii TaxID=2055160 RepID=UPI001E4FBAC7|nr:TIGR04053 family radical SAM/SPASM domain-containing protein [Kyrpidia spormannii]